VIHQSQPTCSELKNVLHATCLKAHLMKQYCHSSKAEDIHQSCPWKSQTCCNINVSFLSFTTETTSIPYTWGVTYKLYFAFHTFIILFLGRISWIRMSHILIQCIMKNTAKHALSCSIKFNILGGGTLRRILHNDIKTACLAPSHLLQ